MEARGRSGGFGFPGYDGSLPRAVRSSRSRGEVPHKANNPQSDMRYFELLATVAGQVLQDGNADEHDKSIATMQKSTLKTVWNAEEEGGGSQTFDTLLEQRRQVLLDGNVGRDDKCFQIDEVGDLSIAEKGIVCVSLTSKKSESLKDSMQQEAHEGNDVVETSCEGLLHSTICLQNKEDPCSMQQNMYMSTGNCTTIKGVDHGMDTFLFNANQSNPVFQREVAAQNSEHGFFDMPGHAESKVESDANCRYCQDWIKGEEGSCMTARDSSVLDEENRPLDSSGSSKEGLTCMENKPCDIVFNRFFLENQLESRQEVAPSKARDDDDNSSESISHKTNLSRPSKPSFMKALQTRRLPDGSASIKPFVARSKRKHDELAENANEKGDTLYGNHTARTQQQTQRWSQSRKGILQGSTFVAPKLHINADNLISLGFSHEDARVASVASSPTSATKLSRKSANQKSGEPHVKVGITSFMVPQLSVDLPETATVANLKRAVMEAAMDLLGGGLHVRVLLQGKKVSDESASLVQVGISSTERLDSLGFMLEPSRAPESPASAEDPLLLLSCAANQPTTRYPMFSVGVDANGSVAKSLNGKSTGLVGTDAGGSTAVQGQVEMVDKPNRNLKAFPCLPHGSLVPAAGALILHPNEQDENTTNLEEIEHNLEGTEVGKRRMRRPFSVTEVEALVKAVEVLGTGRWRDVKLRSFYQAMHRTYVDLKDKWKTLVHTASIAPHQRRGAPVPQELLDRVIQAHTYWTAEQAKQQADLDFK